jgi:hypothetical protein
MTSESGRSCSGWLISYLDYQSSFTEAFFPSDVNPAAAGEISGSPDSPLKIESRKIEGRTPTVGHIAEVRLRGELPFKAPSIREKRRDVAEKRAERGA